MTADHLEVEDTYDLDDDTVLPDLSTLRRVTSVSTVEQELLATYFDTPDLALAAAGVVLRRRTGGEDAGWHLKLPRHGARLEIAVPLGRAVRNPPAVLRQVVAGLVRSETLEPVVTIHTDRVVHRLHDNEARVLAEVVDDRVSAESVDPGAPGPALVTWREAEVELVGGGGELLAEAVELLTSAGARSSDRPSKLARALGDRLVVRVPVLPRPTKKGPAADVIQLRLLEQVAALRRLDPWVRHDAPESVHDMRVAVRRLRHAMASYRRFLDDDVAEPLRDELGWLAALLGGPRDAEVLHEVLRNLVADELSDLECGPLVARIDRDVRDEYDAARADLIAGLASPRYLDLVDRLVAFADQPPWTERAHKRARKVLPQGLDRDWKRLRTRVEAVAGQTTDDDDPAVHADLLHGVRKAAKRVRYAAEPLVPLYGEDALRMVRVHEQIQTVLGDHHDLTEAQKALVELGDRAAAAGEDAFGYGLLYARVDARAGDAAREFDEAWRASVRARDRHRVG